MDIFESFVSLHSLLSMVVERLCSNFISFREGSVGGNKEDGYSN